MQNTSLHNYENEYYRTRLTYSFEAAEIARFIARKLGLDDDITECIAHSHMTLVILHLVIQVKML